MDGEQHPSRVALRQARENIIEQLSQGFARDELSLDEFEKRVDSAFAASSAVELGGLVSDLSMAQHTSATASATSQSLIQVVDSRPIERAIPWAALAIFGSVERQGRWALRAQNRVLALFGNVELDLRSATFPEGETELHVEAIFGNVEITLPPTLAVDCQGWSVFGTFQNVSRMPSCPDGTAVLRITGRALFGNVEFHTRPGTEVHLLGSHG